MKPPCGVKQPHLSFLPVRWNRKRRRDSGFHYLNGYFLDNATVSVMDWGAHAVPWEAPAIVRLVNAHHHLGWTAAPWMPRTKAM